VSEAEWDALIRPYPTATVFHSSAWLAMLKETTGGTAVRLEVREGERVVGYFCGQLIRRGPFRFLGSPLPRWGTPAMGPVADPDRFEQRAFLQTLSEFCRREDVDLLEICCPWLNCDVLRDSGFRAAWDGTFSMPLEGAERAWRNIQSRTRRYIRQAERQGVRVEVATTEQTIHEHYQQLVEVFAKHLSRPPYPVERPLAMWRHLHPSSLMLLQAVYEGRCIATCLVVHDRQTMWALAGGARQDALSLRPNEVLHWNAIERACKMGLRRYDFCGGGNYKRKYGGLFVPRLRWIRAYSPAVSLAYRIAESLWHARRNLVLRVAGWLRR
jgi:CelD/BcsL family acetyltransferase involved in cellulose biosynthesis